VPEPVLAVESLEVRYGAVPVVRGIGFTVGKGEIVGLIGPNGAGKSTTLLALMGAVRPTAGDVRLEGRSLVRRRPEDVVRSGLALVPEGRHIFGGLTVEENLRLGLVGRREADGIAGDLAAVEELFPVVRDARRRQAGALSGGQQQQLAIARGLLAKPLVLLLDEPSLGLAPAVVDTVWEALAEVRRRGVAILLVEQRAQITVALADRTHVLSSGQIRATMTPGDAGDSERMAAAYFGS
jgi:branched-chain amino acid transport system ATP-binding protein